MKKISFLTFLLLSCVLIPVSAQTMRDVWLTMPDTLLPYLSAQARQDMADRYGTESAGPVATALEGQATLDTLAADYLVATPNKVLRLQMRLLPTDDGLQVLCVVRTFFAPAADSQIAFYTPQWEPLDTKDYLRQLTDADLLARPDTMDVAEYQNLCRLLEPRLVEMDLTADVPSLLCRLSLTMVSQEEKNRIKPLLLQTKLNWVGGKFK